MLILVTRNQYLACVIEIKKTEYNKAFTTN